MIPLYKPFIPSNLSGLKKLLNSGSLSYGEWGKKFETKLSEFINVSEVITTNSYNSAMLVLLSTLNLKYGDEILASPVSCLASNQPFVTRGIKIKWVDVDPLTGTIDPTSLTNNINKKTKAIFHNHFCGFPGYIDEINKIGKDNDIYIIDDCIEAFGSEYKNAIMGNCGADATIFSFQTVRLPNTIDGGGLIFKSPSHNTKAKQLRDYGINRSNFRDNWNEINLDCDIKLEGYGALMSEVNSYIGYQQMGNLSSLFSLQRSNANKWKLFFENYYPNAILLGSRNEIKPNYWVFGILTENKMNMLIHLRKQGYYASGIHANNNIYSIFGKQSHLLGVQKFMKKFLAVPSGWWIDQNQFTNGKYKIN